MANESYLFVDANGDYCEDAASIQTSTGSSDADKLVKTGPDGKLDASLINFQSIKRWFIADLKTDAALPASTYANGTGGVGATITADANGAIPAIDGESPTLGDSVLVDNRTPDLENGLYEFSDLGSAGTPWVLTRREDFDEAVEIEDGVGVSVGRGATFADTQYFQFETVSTVGTDSINFASLGNLAIDDGKGITKSGNKLSADLDPAGGLFFTGLGDDDDQIAIDFSTAFNDAKAVKAEDLNSTANGEGASIIGIEDAGGNFTATDVEGALAELAVADQGVSYTVGAGGVTAGDLVYISGVDTVSTFSDITDLSQHDSVIGIAKTTEAAAGSVIVLSANGKVADGILAGATGGDRYWWTGSMWSTTVPTTASGYKWIGGKAKNATDLALFLQFRSKNKAA